MNKTRGPASQDVWESRRLDSREMPIEPAGHGHSIGYRIRTDSPSEPAASSWAEARRAVRT